GLAWVLLGPGKKSPPPGPATDPVAVSSPVPAALPSPAPTPGPTATPPPPTATPAPTVAPLGTALVSSNVYAQVAIDGRAQGGVLAARPIRLAAGRHVASFESGGFGPIRVPFEVKPGESVAVRADFPPLGQLWIHVNPDAVGAELFIDGERVGRAGNAPLKKTVAAGERRVEARLPGFEPAEATVSVFEQEKEDVRLELRRK
nr:PEGA domain-containing protein [Thermoanaerobaculia bacterium]